MLEVATLPSGAGFGELALLYNDKRTASIRTVNEGCEVWVLDGTIFKNIVIKRTLKRRNIELQFINKVNLFQNLE